LQYQLPAKRKLRQVRHHNALAYGEIAAFMAALREERGVAAQALQFLILCAARTGEVLGARWDEVDLQAGMWAIPPKRMKSQRPHRVPLSAAALAILQTMSEIRTSDFIFAGVFAARPLNDRSLLDLLERMGRRDITPHGFRSSFRDWCAECTDFPNHVVEMALAHAVENKVEAAYRRGDLIDHRRRLMAMWAEYCTTPRGEVVPIRRPSE
jgi:integrase